MDPLPLQDLNQTQLKCTVQTRTVTLTERDGLQTHFIEAFPNATAEPTSLPLILLLHGFPELAYSWRKVLAPLAAARGGYHVVAPDLRGYGRTILKHAQIQYDDPIAPFHFLNVAEDACSFVKALGHRSVAMLVGHDFGSIVAGHCAIAHPELFRSVVFMSAPFVGVEAEGAQLEASELPDDDDPADTLGAINSPVSIVAQALAMALESLTPPRKHYSTHNSSPIANKDFLGAGPEDLYHFFGRYYHMKSGAWEGNTIHPLPCASNPSATIEQIVNDLASLPEYYIMPAYETMRQVVDRHAGQNPHFTWPPDEAEAGWVYAAEFTRTGFQGGLNYYRVSVAPPPKELVDRLVALSQRKGAIPAAFVSGARDWGVYQKPGGVDRMKDLFGMQDEDVVLIEGAGHWVQQETPDRVAAELLRFLEKVERKVTSKL